MRNKTSLNSFLAGREKNTEVEKQHQMEILHKICFFDLASVLMLNLGALQLVAVVSVYVSPCCIQARKCLKIRRLGAIFKV